MKFLVLVALFAVAFASYTPNKVGFNLWKNHHQKSYVDEVEEAARFAIWKKNMNFVINHNTADKTYTVAMNEFGDLTGAEFAQRNGVVMPSPEKMAAIRNEHDVAAEFEGVSLPSTVDWRQKNAVTHVKNQGQCGSCWSFSTTGSVEGQHSLSSGNLVSCSEMQLVDCSGSYGNQGCNGGLMDDAFRYLIAVGGDESESEYPYHPYQDPTCSFKKSEVVATIAGYKDIQQGSESQLQVAAANVGPISVAIDASHSSFQFYNGGVYYEPACSSTQLDHGVLVVGYGTLRGSAYWLVKNSWGANWGLNGYIMMSRNRNNNCGIATMASYPTVN